MSFEQCAEDVAALLTHLDIRQADLFGESFGGVVAVMMAVRYPQRVGRVAASAAPLSAFQDAYHPERLGEFFHLSPGDQGVQFQRENYKQVAADPKQWPLLFTKVNRIEWKGFSDDQLKSVKAPVLIACGDHDWIPVERSLEWSRLIPHGQFAVIPHATHFVLNEDPEKLLPTIATFLDESLSDVPLATPRTGIHPGVTR